MRRDVDAAIAALATARAGAFCSDDVAAAGGDRWLERRRVDAGSWLVRPGATFVLAGSPPSLDQRRHLALLAVGADAVLSHEAAAELHRLDGVRRGLVVVTTPHDRRVLERHLAAVIALAGVRAVRQHPLPWDREPVDGCVDAAIVDSQLLLEADGRSWHARLDAMAKDRRRDRTALRAGWGTLRFVFRDLLDDPHGSAEDILATHRQRLAA